MSTLQKDLTVGSPGRVIFNFTVPIFLGNVFQQFYNMADTIIVGKCIGTNALAAVGSTGTIMFLINGFIMGLTTGFTVLTAQKFGSGDMKAMRQTVSNCVLLSLILSVILTICSMIGMKTLLKLMHTPEDIFADAYAYIIIICAGIAAQMAYNLLANILRALGNSKIPLYFLIVAAVLNIVLDLVFIIVFQMRTAGAALATVTSQAISAILCLFYIIKKVHILRLSKEEWKPVSHIMKKQMAIGFPMGFQYSITAIGTMMVQTSLNMLGSMQVAAFTASNKIESMVTQAYVAFGTTMATYCAQNIGAGNVERIRKGFKAAMIMSSIYSIVTGILLTTVGKYLTYLFLSGDLSKIINLVDINLKCVGTFLIPLAAVNIYRNGYQGMGYGLMPMMAGVAELIGRGIVAIWAAQKRSYLGICMANPAAWILADILLIIMYVRIMNHDMKKYEKRRM